MREIITQTVKRAGFLFASALLLLQAVMPMTALADGSGSPVECWSNQNNNPSNYQNVLGDITGTADLVSKDVGSGKIATGVCIKSGDNMFGDAKHSIALDNGTYSGLSQDGGAATPACYTVSGVGTQNVSVSRLIISDTCQGISHIDVIIDNAPADPCDLSISTRIPSDVDCVTFEVKAICRALQLSSFTNSLTGKTWADDYEVRWAKSAPAATQDAYETHGSNVWPAAFTEDYSDGEVTVWYWLVGPENDYISGRGMPNSGDKNAAPIDIDTDCEDPLGSISGYKWNDQDGDGKVDNEPRLEGWKIFIDENDNSEFDNGEAYDLTDAQGNYSFEDLTLGAYMICEVMQPNWVQTWPGNANEAECQDVTLTAQDPDKGPHKNYSFGNKATPNYCDPSQKPGGISVDNWVPKDVNCLSIAVTPACGELTGVLNSNILGSWGDDYSIVWNAGSADYTKFVPLPANFSEDYNGGSVIVYYWIVGPEAGYVQGHAGLPNFWDQNAASVVIDTDCEDPKGSITIVKELEDEEDEVGAPVFDFTTTGNGLSDFSLDVNGVDSKTFTNLETNYYTVTEILPDGWDLDDIECSIKFEDKWDDWDEDLEFKDGTVTIPFKVGQHITCVFTNEKDGEGVGGGFPKGSISGHKFNDANGNNKYDEGEELLSGFTIELYNACIEEELDISSLMSVRVATEDTDDCVEELIASDVTDENGEYMFENLLRGDYYVCEVQQDGWVQTFPLDQNNHATCWLVELGTGDDATDQDFGNKAEQPGEVLGEETPKPPVLAETGSSFSYGIIVALSIIGTAAGIVTRRQQPNSSDL